MRARRAKTPEAKLAQIAAAIATEINLQLTNAGLACTPETLEALVAAVAAEQVKRREESERAGRESADKQARRGAWIAEHGLLTWKEAQERLGLTMQELSAAKDLDLVRSLEVPMQTLGPTFMHDRVLEVLELTPAERTQIAENVLLTRLKATERLGITPAKFDTLRKRAGIKHAKAERGDSGWPMYLYRQSDVDRLREIHACDGYTQTGLRDRRRAAG